MSQKDRARAIVARDYEFTLTSRLESRVVVTEAMAAAAGARTFRAHMQLENVVAVDDVTTAMRFSMRGPGGFVELMAFVVAAEALPDGRTKVSLHVGDFLYEKGPLGMNPSINGKACIGKFVAALRAAVA